MAVSIALRPLGWLHSTPITCGIDADSTGLYLTTSPDGHGLLDNDYVYIKSTIGEYNGYHIVDVITSSTAYLYRTIGGLNETLIQQITRDSALATYSICDENLWHSVHLPIIYQLRNTLWPVNSVDTVRTLSVTNSNGYCAIVASGDIKATGSAAALEYVKITNAGDYNGVYQIIAYTNDTTFTIDLAYSTAADTALTAGNIQYYYNNYVTKVQVWGGLNIEHEFYAQEPYELLATLDLIPDEDGVCKFSISEILKQNIAIKNNLLLGTLPNNLDAFTKFFIKYGEEYDDSDGTTLSRSTVSYTDDYSSFQGYAVNSKLPFKNVYSGALSEYNTNPRLFLTEFVRPTIFPDKYFDLSFLLEDGYGLMPYEVRAQRYTGETLTSTDYTAISNFNSGVYRAPIEVLGSETRIDAAIVVRNTAATNSSVRNTVGSTSTDYDLFVPAGYAPPGTYSLSAAMGGSSVGDLASAAVIYIYDDGTSETVVTVSRTTDGTTNSGTVALPTPTKNVVSVRATLTIADVPPTGGAFNATVSASIIISGSDVVFSEVKTCDVDQQCLQANAEGIYLAWQNYLGGFNYWHFKAYSDDVLDIIESTESEVNTFVDHPNSIGEFADTEVYQTSRKSRTQKVVRSQTLTLDQLNAIKYIKSSILAQIVNSIYDRRTVPVDKNSFKVYTEGQQTSNPYTIEFTITYTDDVPSQKV